MEWPALLMMLLATITMATIAQRASQLEPRSPCSEYFQYTQDKEAWQAVVTVPAPPLGTTIALNLKMSIPNIPAKDAVGRIEILGDRSETLQRILNGMNLRYAVHFPMVNPIPKVTEITFNGQVLCKGPPATPPSGFATTISLDHVLKTQQNASTPNNNATTSNGTNSDDSNEFSTNQDDINKSDTDNVDDSLPNGGDNGRDVYSSEPSTNDGDINNSGSLEGGTDISLNGDSNSYNPSINHSSNGSKNNGGVFPGGINQNSVSSGSTNTGTSSTDTSFGRGTSGRESSNVGKYKPGGISGNIPNPDRVPKPQNKPKPDKIPNTQNKSSSDLMPNSRHKPPNSDKIPNTYSAPYPSVRGVDPWSRNKNTGVSNTGGSFGGVSSDVSNYKPEGPSYNIPNPNRVQNPNMPPTPNRVPNKNMIHNTNIISNPNIVPFPNVPPNLNRVRHPNMVPNPNMSPYPGRVTNPNMAPNPNRVPIPQNIPNPDRINNRQNKPNPDIVPISWNNPPNTKIATQKFTPNQPHVYSQENKPYPEDKVPNSGNQHNPGETTNPKIKPDSDKKQKSDNPQNRDMTCVKCRRKPTESFNPLRWRILPETVNYRKPSIDNAQLSPKDHKLRVNFDEDAPLPFSIEDANRFFPPDLFHNLYGNMFLPNIVENQAPPVVYYIPITMEGSPQYEDSYESGVKPNKGNGDDVANKRNGNVAPSRDGNTNVGSDGRGTSTDGKINSGTSVDAKGAASSKGGITNGDAKTAGTNAGGSVHEDKKAPSVPPRTSPRSTVAPRSTAAPRSNVIYRSIDNPNIWYEFVN